MQKGRKFFLISAFLAMYLFSSAQNGIKKVSIPRTHTFDINSKINGQQYRLFISLPSSYKQKNNKSYPVLYLLDGNPFFTLLHSIQDFFITAEDMPEIIIVGIGYPVDGLMKTMKDRSLDYTPTRDTAFDAMLSKEFNQPFRSGGADKFLKVLKKEIFPLIEKKYKIVNDRTIAGHSFGGLFGAYVLFQEPQLFNRYLLSSISFPWDHEEIVKRSKSFFLSDKNLSNIRLFISVGGQEPSFMIDPMKQMIQSLKEKKYPGVELDEKVFENETHTSVVPSALSAGLRSLYKGMVTKVH